jgi:hypothetical protein
LGDNIGNLEWHYNNTLNKLIKADKTNTTEYCVYDYQGRRIRTVIEANNQAQSQSCISPRGGRGFSADIKGIFGFKYRKTLS